MRWTLGALAALTLACNGSTPVDFAGTYNVTVQNGTTNPCNLNGWTAGNASANIPVTITQDNTVGEFQVAGAAGLYLDLVLETSSFPGTVMGDTFTATYLGTKTQTQQTCNYTTNMTLETTLASDTNLNGTLTYTSTTNGDPTCGAITGCMQQQTVVGVRTAQ
jgi:hypothetical protein